MNESAEIVSAFEARTHFGEIIKNVSREGKEYIVEKGGIPAAVIIGIHEYKMMKERLVRAGT